MRSVAQIANLAELDRLRRTRLGAGRLHASLKTVVTECAFLRGPRGRIDFDHAKRAGRNTIAAAVAGIGLNDDRVEFGPGDRAGGADFETRRLDAVLAHVAHQEPAPVLPVLSELLDEFDVAPVDSVKLARVVVAVAAQSVQPAVSAGELIPLFAGHFAGFAADADRRVGIKSHGFSHKITPNRSNGVVE